MSMNYFYVVNSRMGLTQRQNLPVFTARFSVPLNLSIFFPLPRWTPTVVMTLQVYYFGSAKAQHLSLVLGDLWIK